MSTHAPHPPSSAPHAPTGADGSGRMLRVRGDGLLHDGLAIEARYRGVLFGPELEFYTVDRRTLAPRDCLDAVAAHPLFGSLIQPELAREQIEITTPPTASLRELETMLVDLTADLVALLKREHACPLPVALFDTAPLSLADAPRYPVLASVLGEPFRRHAPAIAADQVNIGADGEAQAFRIYDAVMHFLPDLMRFTAASPFRHGTATAVACNRLDCYDAALAGFPGATDFPPRLASLDDYVRELERQAVFQHPSTCYRYVRPMPHRGVAVEVRCLDKQPTLAETLALLALCKAFVHGVLAGGAPDPAGDAGTAAYEVAAMRFGDARRAGLAPTPADYRLLDGLAAHLDATERHYLRPLYASLTQGGPAAHMRRTARRYGHQAMLHRLVDTFLAPFG
jgi:gamma-glutamyl:cysteine ligase YbdK (ATP-grasp superfamily)